MGILQDFFARRSANTRSTVSVYGSSLPTMSIAGPIVGPATALSSATVWACVSVLSGSVAQMPLKLYRRLKRGKMVADDHPLYHLLHDRPNPYMSAFALRETMMAHLLTWGNAYAEIEWTDAGYPAAIWPLLPDRMDVRIVDRQPVYVYRPDSINPVQLPRWRVFHIPGLGYDGLIGYSPIRMQMQTLGGERAQAEFGWRFFANGARPGVVLKHPGKLSDQARRNLRDSWSAQHSGVDQSHRTAILEEGMSIEAIGIPPEEAQFLETRQFTKREIASIYRVPPHMLGDTQTATYASAEQFSRDFVVFSLGEWLRRWEENIALQLLLDRESQDLFPQFVRDSLIITQTGERMAAYAAAIQHGILTPNEAREKENLNPLPGGDDLLLPLNMQVADNMQAGQSNDDSLVRTAWLADMRARLTSRIANDVRQQGGKALRQGGTVAAETWGQGMQATWRAAGQEMIAKLRACGSDRRDDHADTDTVDTWIADAYQQSMDALLEEHG